MRAPAVIAARARAGRQIRRDLHAHPELGFEEKRTSQRVIQALRAAGVIHPDSSIPSRKLRTIASPCWSSR